MPAPDAAAGLGDAIISAVLQVVEAGKLDELVIDDLETQDLERISWSGSPAHLRGVAVALARVAGGEVEYLAVRAPGGEPVAKGGIDYIAKEWRHVLAAGDGFAPSRAGAGYPPHPGRRAAYPAARARVGDDRC